MSNAPFQSLLLDSNAELPEPPDPVCVPDQYYTCGPDGDPYWDNVVLMLHFDGVDGGTTFTDSSQYNKTITAVGNAQLATGVKKFGSAAGFFDGAGDYLEGSGVDTDFDFIGDFTIEAWVRPTDSSRLSIIVNTRFPGGDRGFSFSRSVTNTLFFNAWTVTGNTIASVNGGSIVQNTWHHVAVTRQGENYRIFIDGVQVGITTNTSVIGNATGPITIGFDRVVSGRDWAGYIDDLRITKGIARYTGNFTIPKEAYPDFREPSNQISPLTQTPGGTGWTVTNPSPLVHKAVAVSALSSYTSARFETTEFFGKRYVEFKVIGPGRSPNNNGTGYLFGLQQVGVPTQANPFSTPSIGFSMYKLVSSTGFTVNGDAGNSNSAYTFNDGDVICFAYDSQTGRLWVRRNANAWIGGGDPVADTNPTQVINSKLQRPWVSVYNSTNGSSGTWEVEIVVGSNAVFTHTPPTGFAPFGGDYTFDPRTVLSLHADDQLDASCSQEKTITLTGTAEVSVEQVKFGTGAFKITNTGTSTVNGLQIRDHQDFNFGTQDFTLELWAYKLNHTYINTLFFSSNLGGGTFSIITAANTGQITVTYRSSGGGQTASNLGVFPLNQWVFVTLQRRNNLWEFYINGTLVDTRAIAGGANSTVNSAADLFFGRTNVASTQTWNGYIDEIRITRGVARYNETILELIPNTAPHPLTVADDPYFNQVAALFEFEGANNGTVFTDSSINNVTVTVGGGFPVTSTADKKIGNSSLFSSSSGQINFSLPTNTNRTFTLEFWFKRIGTPDYAAFLEINANTRVSLRTPLALGTYQFGILGSTLGEPDSIFTSDTVPQGVWTHLAVCYSAIGTNNGVLRLFIDGELKRTALRNIPAISGATNIGRANPSGFNGFGGYIDSWRLTIGVARYVAPFDPNTLPNCDSTDPPVISTSGNERPVGQFVTVQRGSVTVQDPWVRLQGQQMTAARGNVPASIFNPNRTAAVIGQSVTLSRGNLAIAPYPNLTRISTSGAVAYIEALVPNNGFVCISYYPNGTIQQRYGILNQYLVLWSFSGTWINQNQGYNIVDIAGQYTMRPVTIFIGPPPTVTRTAPDIFMNTGVLPPLALPASMEEAIHFYWLGGSSYPKVQFAIRPAPNNPRYGETNYFHLFNYEHSFTVVQLSP